MPRLSTLKARLAAVPQLKRKLLWCLLNGLLLLTLTIGLQYSSRVRADEKAFYKTFAIIRQLVLGFDAKPEGDDVVFIDVSKDLEVAADTFPNYGKVVLTDRKLLTAFFKEIGHHTNEYPFILCDIAFDYPSENDSALASVIEQAPNLFVAASMNDDVIQTPVFKVPNASVDYYSSGSFVKLPVFFVDTVRTLPAFMAERLTTTRYETWHGMTLENGRLAFNTFIPEFYYRPTDLSWGDESREANIFHLGELMQDVTFFQHHVRGKIIVLGNFTTDIHTTYLGDTPGPMILLNSFLTLKHDTLRIPAWWLLFMFACYLLLSFFIFLRPQKTPSAYARSIRKKLLNGFVRNYISYTGVLIIINLFSYIFFGVLPSLFYVATYLTLLELYLEQREKYAKSPSFRAYVNEHVI